MRARRRRSSARHGGPRQARGEEDFVEHGALGVSSGKRVEEPIGGKRMGGCGRRADGRHVRDES
jgi:hypothetical protein